MRGRAGNGAYTGDAWHLRTADAQRTIVAFAGGPPPPMISQCIISLPWKHGGVDGFAALVPDPSPEHLVALWQAPTQQPFFHCEFFSPTLCVRRFFSFHAIVCGPSQQQQLRHGHGDPRTQKQYVFSSMVIWSPSI